MKKNVMMRLASFLLVAVLISTSAISGTYAKYVTTASGEETARVAKWGVEVYVNALGDEVNGLFAKTYAKDSTTTIDTTVSATDKVVAPGTNNEDDAFKFSITGIPEVDVKVDVVVTEADKDVFLKQATGLPKMTTGDTTDKFDLANDYYPVKYTLTKGSTPVVENVTLAELKTALEGISVAKVDANTDLGTTFGEYEISWKWDYDGANTIDDADTLLGDLAAGITLTPATTLVAGTDYNLTTGLKVSITVTQIN